MPELYYLSLSNVESGTKFKSLDFIQFIADDPEKLAFELALESYRQRFFAAKPSRLSCNFLFCSEESAIKFVNHFNIKNYYIYMGRIVSTKTDYPSRSKANSGKGSEYTKAPKDYWNPDHESEEFDHYLTHDIIEVSQLH